MKEFIIRELCSVPLVLVLILSALVDLLTLLM